MKLGWLALGAATVSAAAVAQMVPGDSPMVPRTGPPCGLRTMIPTCGPMVPTGAAAAPPPGACTAGAIDLSPVTGCNIPFFIGAIFP